MKKKAIGLLTLLLCGGWSVQGVGAQDVALKTNLLYWGTTTPNLGLEIRLGEKTTLDLRGAYNPFRLSSKEENKKIQHWIAQPELRVWNCEAFNGGFWGFHAFYGRYNAGGINLPLSIYPSFKDHRYEGWGTGVGVSYGHQWYLSPHWNLEATFGFGYAYLHYDKFECVRCGDFVGKGRKHYFGPTRIGLSFVYLFKSKTYPR